MPPDPDIPNTALRAPINFSFHPYERESEPQRKRKADATPQEGGRPAKRPSGGSGNSPAARNTEVIVIDDEPDALDDARRQLRSQREKLASISAMYRQASASLDLLRRTGMKIQQEMVYLEWLNARLNATIEKLARGDLTHAQAPGKSSADQALSRFEHPGYRVRLAPVLDGVRDIMPDCLHLLQGCEALPMPEEFRNFLRDHPDAGTQPGVQAAPAAAPPAPRIDNTDPPAVFLSVRLVAPQSDPRNPR